MHPAENIERREEKESSSVQIKLKRYLVKEFRLLKVIGDNFQDIAIVLSLWQ